MAARVEPGVRRVSFERELARSILGIVGTHPGSSHKSGKQKSCGIRQSVPGMRQLKESKRLAKATQGRFGGSKVWQNDLPWNTRAYTNCPQSHINSQPKCAIHVSVKTALHQDQKQGLLRPQ